MRSSSKKVASMIIDFRRHLNFNTSVDWSLRLDVDWSILENFDEYKLDMGLSLVQEYSK